MIFNMVGGGMPLNFKVEAYSSKSLLPATAKENTIAVITDTAITDWIFASERPSSPVAGMVWLKTSNDSKVSFNALKRNSIEVYPVLCEQYTGGAWVTRNGQVFQNGTWTAFWDGKLYSYGDQCEGYTGGWKLVKDGNAIGGTLTFGTNYMRVQGTSNLNSGRAECVSFDPTLLANYNTLRIVAKSATLSSGTPGVWIVPVPESVNTIAGVRIDAAGEYTVSLENIDSGYISVSAYMSTIEIYEIILE